MWKSYTVSRLDCMPNPNSLTPSEATTEAPHPGVLRDALQRLSGLDRAFSSAEAAERGVTARTMERLVHAEAVWRVAHGIYFPGAMLPDGRAFMAEAGLRFPGAVICLRSAAALHGLTTEDRDEATLAMSVDFRPRPAKLGNAVDGFRPVRWLRWTPGSLEEGVGTEQVHGVQVQVTSPARTVVDYFRYGDDGRGRGGSRTLFDREEVLGVLDRYLDGRDRDPALMKLAQRFGIRDMIAPLIEGRRALATRRA